MVRRVEILIIPSWLPGFAPLAVGGQLLSQVGPGSREAQSGEPYDLCRWRRRAVN